MRPYSPSVGMHTGWGCSHVQVPNTTTRNHQSACTLNDAQHRKELSKQAFQNFATFRIEYILG